MSQPAAAISQKDMWFKLGATGDIETRGFSSPSYDRFGFAGTKLDTPNRANGLLLGVRLDHFKNFPHADHLPQAKVKKAKINIILGKGGNQEDSSL